MTKSQYRILEAMADAEIVTVLSPSILAYNLDISRVHASRCLSELVENELVEQVDQGKYQITDAGRGKVTQT